MGEEKLHSSSRESSRVILLQVLPSYLLAGLGMVTAGLLLDRVQRINCVLSRQQQHHVLMAGTAPGAAQSASPTYSEDIEEQGKEEQSGRETPSRLVYLSGISGKPWQRQSPTIFRQVHLSGLLHTAHSLDGHPSVSLIKMRKGLQGGQAHTGHQYSVEEKEREGLREEKEQQHRRAEKKLLAFWMSLSHRTWTFFRPRERPSFQRSASAARLLKSEA
ncbi:hypothetical protein Q8A73_005208 [Channa argus]|nr:hypothetical protein Q8A73_005208 [Channa argus]